MGNIDEITNNFFEMAGIIFYKVGVAFLKKTGIIQNVPYV